LALAGIGDVDSLPADIETSSELKLLLDLRRPHVHILSGARFLVALTLLTSGALR
jgi:hypothetical protein